MSAIPHVQNPTGRLTREHPGLVKLARLGWLAKGIVYLLAGVLVLGLLQRALGWSDSAGGQEASPTGALNEVAATSWGPALLWALAIGLFLYAAWRVISALATRQWRRGELGQADRVPVQCGAVRAAGRDGGGPGPP